ncbi:hypothetical protein GGR53DRAFT_489161 [Hypoxylon sp. FL1150]|nr:hypothetical protein GGR53DRAFT_489161 [Hypoxylon sp. FL1150]
MAPYKRGMVLCGENDRGVGGCDLNHIEEEGMNDINIPKPRNSDGDDYSFPDIRGFRALQTGPNEWLNADSIESAIGQYHRALPSEVRSLVQIQKTDPPGLFESNGSTATYKSAIDGALPRPFMGISKSPYTIWPANIDGQHWVLLFIRKEVIPNVQPRPRFGNFLRVTDFAILDSWYQTSGAHGRREMIRNRLRRLLMAYGFQFTGDPLRPMTLPIQEDIWSCGLRVFWAAKNMMDRVAVLVREGLVGKDESLLFDDLRGWFNARATRWEMVGLSGYAAIIGMDFQARLSIELVKTTKVKDGNGITKGEMPAGNKLRPLNDAENDRMPPPTPRTPGKTPKSVLGQATKKGKDGLMTLAPSAEPPTSKVPGTNGKYPVAVKDKVFAGRPKVNDKAKPAPPAISKKQASPIFKTIGLPMPNYGGAGPSTPTPKFKNPVKNPAPTDKGKEKAAQDSAPKDKGKGKAVKDPAPKDKGKGKAPVTPKWQPIEPSSSESDNNNGTGTNGSEPNLGWEKLEESSEEEPESDPEPAKPISKRNPGRRAKKDIDYNENKKPGQTAPGAYGGKGRGRGGGKTQDPAPAAPVVGRGRGRGKGETKAPDPPPVGIKSNPPINISDDSCSSDFSYVSTLNLPRYPPGITVADLKLDYWPPPNTPSEKETKKSKKEPKEEPNEKKRKYDSEDDLGIFGGGKYPVKPKKKK